MTAIAIIALIVSIGAAGLAGWDAWSDRRSAKAAEDSAVSARQAAESARESAEAAARTARADAERDHQAREPVVTDGKFVFEEINGIRNLAYRFYLNREFAMTAAVTRNGPTHPSSDRHVSGPDKFGVYRINIDSWPRVLVEQPWNDLLIEFWPPAATANRAIPWTCHCDRPTSIGDGPGHWDKHVIIVPPRPAVVV